MAVVLANNAVSRLASSLTSGATTLSVTTGEGAKFPSPSAGQWFPVTLVKATGALEIIRCTSRSGDILTVARAQEGTSAQAFAVGDRVELRLTNAAVLDIQQQITDLAAAALLDANNLSDLADKPTARLNLGLGTGATATVQTSPTDKTAGRLMTPGAFGWGGNAIDQTGDLNALAETQVFDTNASTTNVPVGQGTIDGQGYGFHIQHPNSAFACQQWTKLNEVRSFFRVKVSGTWTGWVEYYHTFNITTYAKTLLAAVDAAAARTILGLGTIATLSSVQACNAWVNFNGTGTVAIRGSFNVSSVTDNGTGNYSVNFTSNFANANYSPVVSAKNESASTGGGLVSVISLNEATIQIVTGNSAGTLTDHARMDVSIFGGK